MNASWTVLLWDEKPWGMVTAERVVVLLLEVLASVGYKCNNYLSS